MEYVKLKEVCTTTQGVQISKAYQISEKEEDYIPYLYIADFKDTNDSKYVKNNYKEKIVTSNDLVMANTGSPGAVFKGKYGVLSNNLFKISFDNDLYNRDFLYYYFSSDEFQNVLQGKMKGGVQKHLGHQTIGDQKIPVISKENQDKIVKVLDKAQELMDKRKEQIELLDELVKSKFIEMFGHPINNPMGWKVKKLNDISTKILSGNTPKGGSQVYVDDGILFLRSQNVWKNKLELDDVAYIDQETHAKMSKSSLKNRDILMTKTGRINTENSSLGRAAMYVGEDDSANINGHVYLIRLKQDIINEFVLFILTTNEYRDYIRRICVGGIDKRQINKEHLEEFPIIFPPTELQNEFVDLVKQVDKLKFEMEKSLKDLEDNFNALMQKAFKGELF